MPNPGHTSAVKTPEIKSAFSDFESLQMTSHMCLDCKCNCSQVINLDQRNLVVCTAHGGILTSTAIADEVKLTSVERPVK